MPEILVLYYSHRGAVKEMAQLVARGIEQAPGVSARLRTVPQVASVTTVAQAAIPEAGAPYCEPADLEQCIGLALGSPTRFGNMAAPMKHFWDGTGGTPYGASHVAGGASDRPISADEKTLCIALGRRLAGIALKLVS